MSFILQRSFWRTFKRASFCAVFFRSSMGITTTFESATLVPTSCTNPALVLTRGHVSVGIPTASSTLITKVSHDNMGSQGPYHFEGYPNLSFGYPHVPQFTLANGETTSSWNKHEAAARRSFQPGPGVYHAKDLVAMFAPLLDTCIRRVGGQDPTQRAKTRDVLIEGLQAILATSGRESSLPLQVAARGSNGVRMEMTKQAETIGKAFIKYTRDALDTDTANPNLKIMSSCDGHLWTHAVVGELMGKRGDSVVMQLYNEWSHRVVLLRNALLPFENWEEVPIVIKSGQELEQRGMRALEGPSNDFVMKMLSGRLPQKSIVDLAKNLTAPTLPLGGFGFQYSQGTVLPAFFSGSRSPSLLRYYPTRGSENISDILFEYEHISYEAAERSQMPTPKGDNDVWAGWAVAHLKGRPTSQPSKVHLFAEIGFQGDPERSASVCVGQIARGFRYAARAGFAAENGQESQPAHLVTHSILDALAQPGLIDSVAETEESKDNTLHLFPIKDPLLGLALMGRLYPGNVVALRLNTDPLNALHVGRGFGTKFVYQPFT